MEKAYILLLLFLITLTSFGQSELREDQHIFKFDLTLTECKFDGTAVVKPNKEVMKRGWKFQIRNIIGANYIIQVSKFTKKSEKSNYINNLVFQRKNFQDIYFKISSAEYLAFAEVPKRRGSFVAGASTTLIKIRPGNGESDEDEVIYSEFGNDFNIGLTAGWRITNYKYNTSVSLVGGLGFSSIKVTPQTTRDFIDSESTQSAVTFSAGAIFEIEKFQISTFIGMDTMSGEIGKNWIYRNRPWIGLGFGYEIFKTKGVAANNNKPD